MLDLIKTASFIYVIFSAFVSIIFFSKAEVNFLLLLTIPIIIVFQSLMVLLICFALCKILENMGYGKTGEANI